MIAVFFDNKDRENTQENCVVDVASIKGCFKAYFTCAAVEISQGSHPPTYCGRDTHSGDTNKPRLSNTIKGKGEVNENGKRNDTTYGKARQAASKELGLAARITQTVSSRKPKTDPKRMDTEKRLRRGEAKPTKNLKSNSSHKGPIARDNDLLHE
ncbi:unnamed protein product [Ceratitis capitata]|uniref:(Mediterranean fruit fly) hypothetical protein n=1 Tax=Ceratitis capitata TaxID=7213 RepID=A0A811UE31_CERCA|nr:unnamed protein product [Ceratitis capitata]